LEVEAVGGIFRISFAVSNRPPASEPQHQFSGDALRRSRGATRFDKASRNYAEFGGGTPG
jgi:hypothetical protein